MSRTPIALLLCAAVLLAAAALALAPHAIDAAGLLTAQGDPAGFVDRQIANRLNAQVAAREIEDALAAGDADLAQSFVDLADDHGVPIAPELAARVARARAQAGSAARTAENFAEGFVSGEPNDIASFAGTSLGDLFVFGDIRDAVREGTRLATGAKADRVVLGLACVGLAITAGTYATIGSAAPIRLGLTLLKAARKTGRLGTPLALWLGRSLRQIVDWNRVREAVAGAARTRPAVSLRAARDAVKLGRAGGLINLVRAAGRIERAAGTRAAIDGLKIARGPRDMARIAKLAEKKGSRTRAILKLIAGGAVTLAVGGVQVVSWLVWLVLALFGFVCSAKAAVERITMRHLRVRKWRLVKQFERELRRRRPLAVNG